MSVGECALRLENPSLPTPTPGIFFESDFLVALFIIKLQNKLQMYIFKLLILKNVIRSNIRIQIQYIISNTLVIFRSFIIIIMKFVIARFQHETNSFSPIPTTLHDFHGEWNNNAYTTQKGVNTAMGAYIDLAEELNAEVLTPFAGFANPSGKY